jgi:hypothetical protein
MTNLDLARARNLRIAARKTTKKSKTTKRLAEKDSNKWREFICDSINKRMKESEVVERAFNVLARFVAHDLYDAGYAQKVAYTRLDELTRVVNHLPFLSLALSTKIRDLLVARVERESAQRTAKRK